MTSWTANIPQAGDALSVSQTQLLGNNNFLEDTIGNAVPGYYRFPNGLKINWGNQGPVGFTNISGSNWRSPIQTFQSAFTTSVYTILITARRNTAGAHYYYVVQTPANRL